MCCDILAKIMWYHKCCRWKKNGFPYVLMVWLLHLYRHDLALLWFELCNCAQSNRSGQQVRNHIGDMWSRTSSNFVFEKPLLLHQFLETWQRLTATYITDFISASHYKANFASKKARRCHCRSQLSRKWGRSCVPKKPFNDINNSKVRSS
jgi:hypothetical protein